MAVMYLLGGLAFNTGIAAPSVDSGIFNLHTATGSPFRREAVKDDTILVIYFGYSTCWRSCPMALNNIATAIDALGPQTKDVLPIFVDMDPAKTSPLQLAKYMRSFGERFVGLLGRPRQVKLVAARFGVTVQKQQFSSDPMDYAMTHTSPIILWNPTHGTPTTLPATSSSEAILAALQKGV